MMLIIIKLRPCFHILPRHGNTKVINTLLLMFQSPLPKMDLTCNGSGITSSPCLIKGCHVQAWVYWRGFGSPRAMLPSTIVPRKAHTILVKTMVVI